jgi:glycerol-3-phosphate dehydrogenase
MVTGTQSGIAAQGRYDVVVIGGGINGTSAARALAASGYKVLLAEQADFANGASSRSSRILHCGLRYFETHHPFRTFALAPHRFAGAVGMARAAMVARKELVRLQPARCKPFTMCFPLYAGDDIRGWHLDLGFALLKRLGPACLPLDYRRLRNDMGRTVPLAADLRDQGKLRSIAIYREYMIDWPDRLCVDAALEAEQDGAEICLFTRAALGERAANGDWAVRLTTRNGQAGMVSAPIVLNMAGTWIDGINREAGRQAGEPLVRGTKGAHIVVRLPERYQGFGIATLHRGGMPFYCLPLGGDRFFFGPTETLYDGDADDVSATDEDIDFLLGEANFLLPDLRLTRRDIEFTWAGVRPLTFDPRQPMGRRTREIHDLADRGLPGVLAMTAGPVMSHMSAGREICRAVSRQLPPSGEKARRAAMADRHAPVPEARHDFPERAFRHAVLAEHARDLKGILYTRTGFAWGRHLDRKTVEGAAASVADLLKWSPAQAAREVRAFLDDQETVFRAGPVKSNPEPTVETGQVGEKETWHLHTH